MRLGILENTQLDCGWLRFWGVVEEVLNKTKKRNSSRVLPATESYFKCNLKVKIKIEAKATI